MIMETRIAKTIMIIITIISVMIGKICNNDNNNNKDNNNIIDNDAIYDNDN